MCYLYFEVISILFLLVFLTVSAVKDFRYRKVSNKLMLCGFFISLIFKMITCRGDMGGFATLFIGFLLVFPFWVIGAIGAGDVKLFCVVSLYFDLWEFLNCMLVSFILGAVAGILILLCEGLRVRSRYRIVHSKIFQQLVMNRSVPFAVCIGIAVLYCILITRFGKGVMI